VGEILIRVLVHVLPLLALTLYCIFRELGAEGGWPYGVAIAILLAFLVLVVKALREAHPRAPRGIQCPAGRACTIDVQRHWSRIGVKASMPHRFSFGGNDLNPQGLPADARGVIKQIFDEFGAMQVFSTGGSLVALVPTGRLAHRGDYETLLRLLDTAARAIEPVPLHVNVLGGERRAVLGHGTPRCAYCHEDVTGLEPDLVACATCSTILHEGCWGELRRCPVLGCEGVSPERARVG
jgi:hypothetical protein